MHYSRQRACILEAVQHSGDHPTAEAVYRLVKPVLPAIGLATVYRNLRTLAEAGQIRRVTAPDGVDRFDGRLQAHDHLICETCGRVVDVDLDFSPDLLRQVRAQTPLTVTGCRLELRGLCPGCAGKPPENETGDCRTLKSRQK